MIDKISEKDSNTLEYHLVEICYRLLIIFERENMCEYKQIFEIIQQNIMNMFTETNMLNYYATKPDIMCIETDLQLSIVKYFDARSLSLVKYCDLIQKLNKINKDSNIFNTHDKCSWQNEYNLLILSISRYVDIVNILIKYLNINKDSNLCNLLADMVIFIMLFCNSILDKKYYDEFVKRIQKFNKNIKINNIFNFAFADKYPKTFNEIIIILIHRLYKVVLWKSSTNNNIINILTTINNSKMMCNCPNITNYKKRTILHLLNKIKN